MIMHNAPMKRIPWLLLLLLPVALAGCQTLGKLNPFHHRAPAYESAQQEKPLEVPPGMDRPPTSEALRIPNAGNAPAPGTATQTAEVPPTVQAPSQAASGAPTGSSSLTFSDTPDSVYHRVGLALQRGGVGSVTASDAGGRTYQVAVDTTVTEKPEGGFFHRLFHHDKTETITGNVTVSVAPSGSGSIVEATGNPEAAARVMAVLKQRLQ